MEILIPILIPLGFFGMVGFIIWTVVSSRRRQEQTRLVADFNTRLLDRIGSFKDFSDFLQTDGGAKFLENLSTERGSIGPRRSILRAVQAGVVLVALGLGCLFLAWSLTAADPRSHEVFTILGVIVLSLGLGCLLAGGVSYRLIKTLGILDLPDRRDVRPAA
jgi:hypothetical protein